MAGGFFTNWATKEAAPYIWSIFISVHLCLQNIPRVWSLFTTVDQAAITPYMVCCILQVWKLGQALLTICCCSISKLCQLLCNPMNCSIPGSPVLHGCLQFAKIHVHWLCDAMPYPCHAASVGSVDLILFSGPVSKISWRRKWQPTPVFLPGKSHGQRSLVGYTP